MSAGLTEDPGSIPLGATVHGSGTQFALWSGIAEAVTLALFDGRGRETGVPLTRAPNGIWSVDVPGVGPGQRYGYRVDGPWDPAGSGARCDPARLLLDPWARAITGAPAWHPSLFPWDSPFAAGASETGVDTAPYMPRCLVVDPRFDWGDDRSPATPLEETIVYEAHVKGLTARHPAIPAEFRGTYAGLAHPAAIEHLTSLGITAVELLPVHQFVHEPRLARLGLRNYWGYASIGFLAPHGEYAAAGDDGGQVREFQSMVRALHAAGLEVILDVVYNHTGEGDAAGPILAFKGIDNAAYYRLVPGAPDRYLDDTSTGNTIDARHWIVQRLILDSLRYWVEVMHVDGFRFDLAATLGRGSDGFDPGHPLLEAIGSDPVISRVKLIAEPWDVGPGGYVPGRFPPPFGEWNDRFRDVSRDLWRGALVSPAELGYRLTGSFDRFAGNGRGPTASLNFVTAHDGFALADLVTYEHKHNDANGESNRDGADHNHAWNHGVEGPTDDPAVAAARRRTQRNLLSTLLLAQGVPMLLAGDELGRTQGGNNNAYNQDNETSWLDWSAVDADLLAFVQGLIALRRRHPALRRRHWLGVETGHLADWFRLDGAPMTARDWDHAPVEGLQLRLDGRVPGGAGVAAEVEVEAGVETMVGTEVEREAHPTANGPDGCGDDALLLVINALPADRDVTLPPVPGGAGPGDPGPGDGAPPLGEGPPAPAGAWHIVLATAAAKPFPPGDVTLAAPPMIAVAGRSLVLLASEPLGAPRPADQAPGMLQLR